MPNGERAQVSNPTFAYFAVASWVVSLPLAVYLASSAGDYFGLKLWGGVTAFMVLFHVVVRYDEYRRPDADEQATLSEFDGGGE